MLRAALRKIGVYYYIFPTYSQARKVIWDSITITGERFLDFIPRELIKNSNSTEMKITLINGSLLQLIGSDNIDALMGTNPIGIVFSEYALQDPRAYQFLRPILLVNDGWAMFVSCVAPNTLVIGNNGLQRIKNISYARDTYTDLNVPIYGLGGFHNAEQFYYGGKQTTKIITLESGYQLECTPIHPIWNGKEWIQSQDLKVGDLIPIQYGQDVWGDGLDLSDFHYEGRLNSIQNDINIADPDFLYLLGLIHADGNYNKNNVCVTKKKDPEIIEFLHKWNFRTRPDGIHHELSSRIFCSLLEYMKFEHGAKNKIFPEILFSCTKEEMKNFLQGLFDGDGTSQSSPSKRGNIKLTSTCKSFMQDLQIVLLNFGIVSSLRMEYKLPTKKVKVASTIYNLEITGYFAHIFYRDIGFRLKRKQKNWDNIPDSCSEESGNVYSVDLTGMELPSGIVSNRKMVTRRILKKLHEMRPNLGMDKFLEEKFFYSPIKEIVNSENEVYDFVIPETHSFFSNGFISHNTPRGKNSLWELYNIAIHSADWFCSKLTVHDTGHISLHEIEKEKAEGIMSEDLIQQEYFTSFELGCEGSYYQKYIDRMRLAGQIGIVPYEIAFKVHTSWDIGVRDSTAIIFFQIIGQVIRIIDCYENSKEGLEHYVKVLDTKPYSYGKHIAPHDIAVKEWGSGMTRIEKAKQLGIKFTLADNISIMDGIESVRSAFSKIWIDEKNCAPLIKALENYRQEYDSKKKVYKSQPLHDINSHFADAMRYLCISLPKTRDGLSAEELEKRYREAMYGEQGNMPAIFRDDMPKY